MKKIIFAFNLCCAFIFSEAQTISTLSGNGVCTFSGDNGLSTAAQVCFLNPQICTDANGNIYFTDENNQRIRKIDAITGIITTIAGTGTVGYSGDGMAATSANLSTPVGIVMDQFGNIYFSDYFNYRVRKISTSGIITTIAGNGTPSSGGDGGLAINAGINNPAHLCIDQSGNIYVTELSGHRVRKIAPNGIISTILGDGSATNTGNNIPATSATIAYPWSIACDASNNIYVASIDAVSNGAQVRKISSSGVISAFAGTGAEGYSGDGGNATLAQISDVGGLAVNALNELFISDRGINPRIRKVSGGIITTIAGTGTSGFSGDGGLPTSAQLTSPRGIATYSNNIYFADSDSRIRKIVALPYGEALNFDGSNDRVVIGNAISTVLDPLNKITVEAWVKPNTNSGLGVVVSNYNTSGSGMQFLLRKNNNQYAFFVDDGTGFQAVSSSPGSVTAGTWQHVAGVWDGSKLLIYINGVLQGTTTGVTGASFASSTNPVVLGYNTINENFAGSIDETRIWTVARTQCEINSYKNCEIVSAATGLLANYHFNQGDASQNNPTVTTLTDASGNGYTGTLISFGLTGTTSNWVAPGGVTSGLICTTPVFTISATITSTNVLCSGASTGVASVTASGDAPFTYSWSPGGGTASTASGLAAGTYSCFVTSACGATVTKTVTITQPNSITVNPVSQTNIACNGGSTGAAQVTASGGTGTLSYNWTPGNPAGDGTGSVTGLSANVWTVAVTDANSCVATHTFNVTQPPVLTINPVSQTNVACFGGSNGAASVSASGGASGFSYNWTPGNPTGDGTASVTGLSVNIWTCTVTDVNACVKTATFNITAPTALVTNTAVTNVACNSGSNGVASITASGGAGGYTYLWSNGGNTSAITGLLAGVYTATVTDANSCTSIKSAQITQPTAIATSTSVTNISCNGGSNGVASVSASGGAGGYTYSWTPSGGTGATASGLTQGNYTVTVTDANSCIKTAFANVTQPTAIATAIVVTNVSCNGGLNGVASVSASGGAGGYTYSWTPSGGAGATASGLSQGNYTVTVTDANSCTKAAFASITQPTALIANSTSGTILCNGGMSTVTVTATGGTSAYTGTGTFTALAGAQTYTVTDANGCSATTSLNITQPAVLAANATAGSILCNGGQSSVTVTATGGTTAYSGVGTFTVLAGTQTYTVTDANGCSATTSITVTEPIFLAANATADAILCNGGQSSVSVTATGGTSAYTGVGTFTALAGTQIYTVTDGNGCSATASITITEPAFLTANATTGSILCNGGMATVTVTANDGTPSYAGTGTFTINAGTSTYTVTDANGCSATASVLVTEPAAIVNSQTVTLCDGQAVMVGANTYTATGTYTDVIAAQNTCDSTVTTMVIINSLPNITVNSGAICAGQSFTIVPNGVSTYTISGGTDVVTPTTDATYTVSGTDANGCVSNVDAVSSITVNALPTIMATTNNTLLCTGETATLSVTGSATSYTWSTTETTPDIAVSPTTQTTYTVEGTDLNGCSNVATVTQDVSLCTGIVALSGIEAQLISVYPNPNNGVFFIELTAGSKVTIMNALGQTILNETMNTGNHELDIHNQADGIYFVKVLQNNKQHIIKIIKK